LHLRALQKAVDRASILLPLFSTPPQIASVHAIFPSVSLSEVRSAVMNCNGDVDRAVEQLLSKTEKQPCVLAGVICFSFLMVLTFTDLLRPSRQLRFLL
jgi:hypothetical protein